jgi:hypothetical protein
VLEAKKAALRTLGVEVPLVTSLAEDEVAASPLSPLSPKSVDSGLARHTRCPTLASCCLCGFRSSTACFGGGCGTADLRLPTCVPFARMACNLLGAAADFSLPAVVL